MACTPIASVTNADPKRTSTVTVMKNIVGPLVIEPVHLASQCKNVLRGNRRNSVQTMQVNKIQSAINPDPARTRATESANKVHPTMSFPIPADNTTIPTVVSKSFSSVKIRQSTGNAVMENAIPVNNMKCVNLTDWSTKVLYNGAAKVAPNANGIAMPAIATVAER